VKMRWWSGRGHRPTIPCTSLPSNGDEELLDGGCMEGKSVLQLVRLFGGRFDPSKWMIVGPWIHGSLTSILGSNQHRSRVEMHPGLDTMAFTWISDVAGQVGHWATPCGIGDATKWAHGHLPCPLASYAPYLSIFMKFPAYK